MVPEKNNDLVVGRAKRFLKRLDIGQQKIKNSNSWMGGLGCLPQNH